MKNRLVSFLMFLILLLDGGFCQNLFSQTSAPRYISIAFIKSKTDEFLTLEKDRWAAIHNQSIKDGKKSAWYLYDVKYPGGEKAHYDYVQFIVFENWKQVEMSGNDVDETIKKIHPKLNVAEFKVKTNQSHEIVWEQLYEVMDEAVTKPDRPSEYVVVNQVKTMAGAENEYVRLERTYFKPFHAERVAIGIMDNWGLYKPVFPYGSKYEYDYVTLNGYATWEDIMKNNPPGPWKKAHGDVNFNEIHSKILSLRMTVNNELWKLVTYSAGK